MIRNNRWMGIAAVATLSLLITATAPAQVLRTLTSFGGGDGWLAPGENGFLTTNNNQRGMTYNAATNSLYVVDRDGGLNVRIFDGDTGAQTGTLDVSTVAAPNNLFALSHIDVADDGAIYSAGLSLGGDVDIYRWASEAAVPTLAASTTFAGLGRLGDSFAATGSGTDTRLAVGGSGSDGVLVLDTADGLNFTATGFSPLGTVPAGGMRLGLDFIDSNTLIGKQTGADFYTADLTANTSTTDDVNAAGEAPLAYYAADTLLATIDINSSDVRLYDATDLSLLDGTQGGFLDIANNLTAPSNSNGNGAGDAKFGIGPDGRVRLYAMNTNNGIQAFFIGVPEPSTLAILLLASGMVGVSRRR